MLMKSSQKVVSFFAYTVSEQLQYGPWGQVMGSTKLKLLS